MLNEPMKTLLNVSSSKEMGDRTGKRKTSLTSAGIEAMTSEFDRQLLYRLSYEARRVQSKAIICKLSTYKFNNSLGFDISG